jgi:hypothetical protein
LPVGETIVGGLGGHVREVDPLPEHVASGGRLRRGNLQTLNIGHSKFRYSGIKYKNATMITEPAVGALGKSKLSILTKNFGFQFNFQYS